MTSEQLELIPDDALRPSRHGCGRLIDWLHQRGWQMSLAEVEAERARRGMTNHRPPTQITTTRGTTQR